MMSRHQFVEDERRAGQQRTIFQLAAVEVVKPSGFRARWDRIKAVRLRRLERGIKARHAVHRLRRPREELTDPRLYAADVAHEPVCHFLGSPNVEALIAAKLIVELGL